LRPVFARNGYIAAIVERLLQRRPDFFVARQVWHPAFDAFSLDSRCHLELVGFELSGKHGAGPRRVRRCAHARVSSSGAFCALICTNGLNACTGWTGSFSRASAASSLYSPEKVAFTVSHIPRSPLNV